MNVQVRVFSQRLATVSWNSVPRYLGTSSVPSPDSSPQSASTKSSSSSQGNATNATSHVGAPSNVSYLRKCMLVLSGHFKTVADVPPFVRESKLSRADDIMRIYLATVIFIVSCIGLYCSGRSGKQFADSVIHSAEDERKRIKGKS